MHSAAIEVLHHGNIRDRPEFSKNRYAAVRLFPRMASPPNWVNLAVVDLLSQGKTPPEISGVVNEFEVWVEVSRL